MHIGQRTGITYLWAFMLLGQIVAILFASNLFFIAVLLGKLESRHVPAKILPSWTWHLAVFGTVACVAAVGSPLGLLPCDPAGPTYSAVSADTVATTSGCASACLAGLTISAGLFLASAVIIDV